MRGRKREVERWKGERAKREVEIEEDNEEEKKKKKTLWQMEED